MTLVTDSLFLFDTVFSAFTPASSGVIISTDDDEGLRERWRLLDGADGTDTGDSVRIESRDRVERGAYRLGNDRITLLTGVVSSSISASAPASS